MSDEANGNNLDVTVRAVKDFFERKMALNETGRRIVLQPTNPEVILPPTQVVNEVHPTPIKVINEVLPGEYKVVVNNDMTPVAEAIDRQTDSIQELCTLLHSMVTAFSNQPAPVHQFSASMPELKPEIVMPDNRPTKAKIKHADGTESTITLS